MQKTSVGEGPSAIFTTLGILRPHPQTKEFELSGWFAFTNVDEIRASTGWDLKVAAHAQVLPEPSAAELVAMRRVDETGMLRKQACSCALPTHICQLEPSTYLILLFHILE